MNMLDIDHIKVCCVRNSNIILIHWMLDTWLRLNANCCLTYNLLLVLMLLYNSARRLKMKFHFRDYGSVFRRCHCKRFLGKCKLSFLVQWFRASVNILWFSATLYDEMVICCEFWNSFTLFRILTYFKSCVLVWTLKSLLCLLCFVRVDTNMSKKKRFNERWQVLTRPWRGLFHVWRCMFA